ncbi:hypothetical protein LCGC14_2433770, partial [marine sediment metagenome]
MSKKTEIEKSTAKGKLEFKDCYSLYKFIDALSLLVDEIPLIVDSENNQLVIKFMDPSRICLIEVFFGNLNNKKSTGNINAFLKVKKNDKKSVYSIDIKKSGKQATIIDDLKNVLKVKKNDKKSVSIIFGDPYRLLIEKKSGTLGIIKKNLNYINLDFMDISMSGLNNMQYPTMIKISQKLLDDFFYEAGVYSEIIGLEINNKGIHFTENGVIGDSDIFYESKLLNVCDAPIKSEKSYYSLSFLNLVKPIVSIMEENDTIKFELKTDHPLKVSIKFDKIGAEITYYLACRILEEE